MMSEVDLASVDLNLLVAFEAVYEARHVGRAATRLHLTSSAVSHALGRLRELLGDPLFLRTPRGVVPTQRAEALAPLVVDVLARVRGLLGMVEPFDPARSSRRFRLGLPDATAAVLLPRLMAALREDAPGIDLTIHQLLPMAGLGELERGELDLVVLALDEVPARFHARVVYEEAFVIAMRAGHPHARAPTLKSYLAQQHVLVSTRGDHTGYVDEVLAAEGRTRRVALSVPNFMLALAAIAESDLLGAIPRSLVDAHAARFSVVTAKTPLALRSWQLRAVVVAAALEDAGIAWLLEAVTRALASKPKRPSGRAAR
ncbi:MAG: LysR family transcriptional regulator [Polyangiales bacterium]